MENRAEKIERELATEAVWEEVFDGINLPCESFTRPEEVQKYIEQECPDLVSDLVDWESIADRILEVFEGEGEYLE